MRKHLRDAPDIRPSGHKRSSNDNSLNWSVESQSFNAKMSMIALMNLPKARNSKPREGMPVPKRKKHVRIVPATLDLLENLEKDLLLCGSNQLVLAHNDRKQNATARQTVVRDEGNAPRMLQLALCAERSQGDTECNLPAPSHAVNPANPG